MSVSSQSRIKLSFFLFILTAIGYVYSGMFGNKELELTFIALFIPSLALFYLLKSKKKNLAFVLILIFSWLGSILISYESILQSIAGIISFWGVLLLIADHSIKQLKKPLKIQLKKNQVIYSLIVHIAYLIGILYLLSDDLGIFIFPITFYGICLLGTSFLGTVLWIEKKNKTRLMLMFGIFMILGSGSILSFKLFGTELSLIQDFLRLSLYVVSELFICLYFIHFKETIK